MAVFLQKSPVMMKRAICWALAGMLSIPFYAQAEEHVVTKKVVTSDAQSDEVANANDDEETVAETEVERTEVESHDQNSNQQKAGQADTTEVAQERTVVRQKEVVHGGL